MPWFTRLDTGQSLRRSGFDLGPVRIRSALDKVALGQVFLRLLPFSPVLIIPPMPHIHLHLHVTLTRMTNG